VEPSHPSHLGCDGGYAVCVGAAVEPSSYAADVQRLLGQHPGSSYLYTPDNCTSLRSRADNGNAIYAIFYGPYTTSEEACARKSAVGGGTYVRRLDNVTPPGTNVCGR
jgi:serine/threonine-protein kinase